jgi:hypothetical protein
MLWGPIRTRTRTSQGMVIELDVRLALVATALTTDPFAVVASIVMAVEGEGVAMWTEGRTLGIIAAFETGGGIVVDLVTSLGQQAQSTQVLVDISQDFVESLSRIAGHFADKKVRKAAAQFLKAGDRLQVVVAVGGDKGSRERPVGEETVIQYVEGFGFVAKVMFAFG